LSDIPKTFHDWVSFFLNGDDMLLKRWMHFRRIRDFKKFEQVRRNTLKKARSTLSTLEILIHETKNLCDPIERLKLLAPAWVRALKRLYDVYACDLCLGRRDPMWIRSKVPESSLFGAKPRRNIADHYEERLEKLVSIALRRKSRDLGGGRLRDLRAQTVLDLFSLYEKLPGIVFLEEHLALMALIESDQELVQALIKKSISGKDFHAGCVLEIIHKKRTPMSAEVKKLAEKYYEGDEKKLILTMLAQYRPLLGRTKSVLETLQKCKKSATAKNRALSEIKAYLNPREYELLEKTLHVLYKIQELNSEDEIEHTKHTLTTRYVRLTNEIIELIKMLREERTTIRMDARLVHPKNIGAWLEQILGGLWKEFDSH